MLAVLVLAFGAKEVATGGNGKAPVLSLKGMDKRFKVFLMVVVLFTLGNSSDSFIILRGQERGGLDAAAAHEPPVAGERVEQRDEGIEISPSGMLSEAISST